MKSEDRLFRAYGQIPPGKTGMFRVYDDRIEQCVCGELIVAGPNAEEAVAKHNRSPVHVEWRKSRG